MDKVQAIRMEAIHSYKLGLAEDIKQMIICPEELEDESDSIKLMVFARNDTIVRVLEMMGVME